MTDDSAGCGACGARLPDHARWCSLCFAPVRRSAPAAAAAAAVAPGAAAPAAAAQAAAPPAAGWPCACGTSTPLAEPVCAGCGAGFLQSVRDGAPPLLRLPLVGDPLALSRPVRLGLAAALVLLLLLAGVVATVLLASPPSR